MLRVQDALAQTLPAAQALPGPVAASWSNPELLAGSVAVIRQPGVVAAWLSPPAAISAPATAIGTATRRTRLNTGPAP